MLGLEVGFMSFVEGCQIEAVNGVALMPVVSHFRTCCHRFGLAFGDFSMPKETSHIVKHVLVFVVVRNMRLLIVYLLCYFLLLLLRSLILPDISML